ncbi:hypothetical protein E1162_05925 [Rhodobacteraceae bacterium RKSG542]|uniref:hypothetical protein n=1 Tax=Pseudovibrio flavus TaxID=2529854 RepID=UPI0012BB58AB|nr:hypothetical protein [Pseudovibrio flavus]MTI16771.1 hypothetical protein [Pseudovibrio flavus]
MLAEKTSKLRMWAKGAVSAVALTAVIFSHQAHAQIDVTSDPDAMVLELQILQDEIIEGNLEAYKLLQPSLLVLGRRFLMLDEAVWNERRHANAAIAFMLSGGSGAVFQELARRGVEFNADANLFAGAMAYSQGNRAVARNLLMKVDAMKQPVSLAGQIALAQGILLSLEDPKEANRYFDLARLFMPGTLVEESALRRQTPLVAKMGDHQKFQRLAQRYLFQYARSVFADSFRDQMADAIVESEYLKAEDDWTRVEQIVSEFEGNSQVVMLSKISRASLLNGNKSFALNASDLLLKNEARTKEQEEAAIVYKAGAMAVGESWNEALRLASSADHAKLSSQDQVLASVIVDTANSIRTWPTPPVSHSAEFGVAVPQYGLEERLSDPEMFVGVEGALESAHQVLLGAEF